MALIHCPECNHEVSDKAISCPHCGYPLNNKESLFDVIYTGFKDVNIKNKNQAKVVGQMRQIIHSDLSSTVKILNNPPYTLATGLNKSNADKLKQTFESYGCVMEIKKSESDADNNEILDKFSASSNMLILCPHCGSNQITTGSRGFSFATGFIGAGKTVNRCSKCGWKWEP